MARHRFLLFLWLGSDALLFIGSFVLAYFVRVGWIFSSNFPFAPFLTIVIVTAPLWLIIQISQRTFRLTETQTDLRHFLSLVWSNVVGIALFSLAYFFAYDLFTSRLLLVEALLFSTIILWIWHMIFTFIARRSLWRDPAAFPTLIVGATREAAKLIEMLQRRKNPLKPVAILDGRGTSLMTLHGVPVIGKLDKLEETLERFHISHLIQCSDLEQSLNLLSVCRNRSLTYLLLPSVLGIVERDERVESLENVAVMIVRPQGRSA